MKQGTPSIALFATGGKAYSLNLSCVLFLAADQSKNAGCPTLATLLFLWLGWVRMHSTVALCFLLSTDQAKNSLHPQVFC
jgi:hypothetical protein